MVVGEIFIYFIGVEKEIFYSVLGKIGNVDLSPKACGNYSGKNVPAVLKQAVGGYSLKPKISLNLFYVIKITADIMVFR